MKLLNIYKTVLLLVFNLSCFFAHAERMKDGSPNKNQKIFQETLKYIQDHSLPALTESIYDGSQNVTPSDPSFSLHNIFVMDKGTFRAAQDLVQAGYKPMVLDMANKTSPGGSVLKGSNAQEETLCRQSDLYIGLTQADAKGYYPILEMGGILIKDVTFFRNGSYEFLASPFQTDVFASAAYDCNTQHRPNVKEHLVGYDKPANEADYERGTKAKIRASLRAAKTNGNDALVLGAFGCGAFKNDPARMSHWYKEVIAETEFQNTFKLIIFAILPKDSNNYRIFADCFSK